MEIKIKPALCLQELLHGKDSLFQETLSIVKKSPKIDFCIYRDDTKKLSIKKEMPFLKGLRMSYRAVKYEQNIIWITLVAHINNQKCLIYLYIDAKYAVKKFIGKNIDLNKGSLKIINHPDFDSEKLYWFQGVYSPVSRTLQGDISLYSPEHTYVTHAWVHD